MNARKVTQKRTAENDAEYNKNESKKNQNRCRTERKNRCTKLIRLRIKMSL